MFRLISSIGLIRSPIIKPSLLSPTSTRNTAQVTNLNLPDKIILPDELDLIDAHKFCVTHVRKFDRENYLAALFIDDKLTRRIVFCLRAFNVELALIKDLTTDVNRAKLRFHFWSKLIDEIVRRYNEKDINVAKEMAYYKQSPVARELLDILHLVDLDKEIEDHLRNLIGSRVSSKIIGDEPLQNMRELELYCQKSNASLYQLSHILAVRVRNTFIKNYVISEANTRIAHNLGVAHGLSNVIRGIPYNAAMRCCYIPNDLLSKHNLKRTDFMIVDKIREKPTLDGEKIAPVVEDLANRCRELLDLAYKDHKNVPTYFRHIYLPRLAIEASLKKLRKCNYNVCDPRSHKKNDLLALNLKLASIYYRFPAL